MSTTARRTPASVGGRGKTTPIHSRPRQCVEVAPRAELAAGSISVGPGATLAERCALARLGIAATHLLDGPGSETWPQGIQEWLSSDEAMPLDVAVELESAVKDSPDEVLAYMYAELVSGPRRRVLGDVFYPLGRGRSDARSLAG